MNENKKQLIQYDNRWCHIDLCLVLDEHLPPAYVNWNYRVQVLINLLSNAAYAVEQLKDRLSTVRIAFCLDEGSIRISIRDNGCGIHEERLPGVFDTFSSSKEAGQGSGLGLALCKTLVGEQNVQIEISSQHGESTEVRVSLPLQPVSEE